MRCLAAIPRQCSFSTQRDVTDELLEGLDYYRVDDISLRSAAVAVAIWVAAATAGQQSCGVRLTVLRYTALLAC